MANKSGIRNELRCVCGCLVPLSVGQGMAIQADDLERWRHKLNPFAMVKLLQIVEKHAGVIKLRCGHDVPRGGAITEIVVNMSIEL